MRHVGQQFARLADQLHGARLVQRCERGECEQPSLHVVVDHDGFREFRAAVHDPVPDGRDPVVGRNERREVVVLGGRDDVVTVEDRQLEAARSRVDHQDAHGTASHPAIGPVSERYGHVPLTTKYSSA